MNLHLRWSTTVATALAVIVGALVAVAPAAGATVTSYDFSGTVDSAHTRYIPHALPVPGPATIDATLRWDTTSTDLNLVLKDPTGTIVAQTTSANTYPETIHFVYAGASSGTWKIMAFARSGKSAYTIHATVSDGAQPPQAQDDAASTTPGTAVSVNVLANDLSTTGPLHVDAFTQPAHGSVAATAAPTDSLTYTPAANFAGVDTFTYTACDGATPHACSSANVNVSVLTPSDWNGTVRSWAAENEASSHDYTGAQAVDLATKFRAFITIAKSFKRYVPQMKEANPDLLLFAYVNGTHTAPAETSWKESAYLHDKNGNRVKSARFGTYLMNPWDDSWVNSRPAACAAALTSTGYDNCYVDALATWGFTDTGSVVPLNPGTGSPITKQEWLTATTELARKINAGDATAKPLLGSGGFTGRLYSGTSSSPPERQLFGGLDATLHEGFCRNPNASISTFYPEDWWRQDVEMIRDAEARGKFVLTLTKTWVTAPADQKGAVMKYCLGTFLLGTNGASDFGFTWDKGDAGRYDPLWNTVLGAPSGALATYNKVDGVYQRTFTQGRVLVNPTSSPVTVDLPQPYKNPGGTSVTSVALAPHTAEILTTA